MPVLSRSDVPILQNRLYDTAQQARNAATAKLEIVCCDRCGFVFNTVFRPDRIVYDPSYDNDQVHSPIFEQHMAEMTMRVVDNLPRGTCQVVEIACGQGQFLAMLQDRLGGECRAVGFDPAWRGAEAPQGVRIERSYFDRQAAAALDGRVDAVIARHVVEHIPDPVGFLSSVRSALPDDWSGTLYLETPCIEWILENQVFQDFFYEHCSYFSADTLDLALQTAGFSAYRIDRVFGGQYLWAEARLGQRAANIPAGTSSIPQLANRFHSAFQILVRAQIDALNNRVEDGVAVWGSGAKGVTYVTMLDPSSTLIRGLIDVNPRKQGRFVPVTGHAVWEAAVIAKLGIGLILVMNPNYLEEVRASVKMLGVSTKVQVHTELLSIGTIAS